LAVNLPYVLWPTEVGLNKYVGHVIINCLQMSSSPYLELALPVVAPERQG
jgi:hypothetical protein